MKSSAGIIRQSAFGALFFLLYGSTLFGVTFTSNTFIADGNTTFDGEDIVVDGAVLTVDGEHTFASLSVINGGSVTHSSNQALGMRLTITGDLTVEAGSSINVDGRGFPVQQGPGGAPGASFNEAGGGGHGGSGADGNRNIGGLTYGSIFEPAALGSGAGAGGVGGGAVRLIVAGTCAIDGDLSANGTSSTSGGAGGSIWVTCTEMAGNGTISASGGSGSDGLRGSGGGGRVALYFDTKSFTGAVTACGGNINSRRGGAGSIYEKRASDPRGTVTIDNCGFLGARTDMVEGEEVVDADVVVRSGASWGISEQRPFEANVLGNLTVEADGSISASGRGFPAQQGPGAAPGASFNEAGGGGYGGAGGPGNRGSGGGTYGSFLEPTDFGSGSGSGAQGGGAVLVTVDGTFTLDGTVSADGNSSTAGGSGGSIWITTGQFAGAGSISSNGGSGVDGLRGGGGGGRIAVYYDSSTYEGTMTACGGDPTNRRGGAGTVYTKQASEILGTLIIDNCGTPGQGTDLVNEVEFVPASVIVRGEGLWSPKTGVLFDATVAGDVTLESDGRLGADARGFPPAEGPGGAPNANFAEAGGAGYGGAGASGSRNVGGMTYGSIEQPLDFGSGGGNSTGRGGGAVRLRLGGTLTVNGRISSDGADASSGGGSSGGSVWLEATGLAGTGVISARGGNGSNSLRGGGGGGRIASYFDASTFSGTMSTCGGGPENRVGGAGTIYTKDASDPLAVMIIDNCGQPDTGARTDLVGDSQHLDAGVIVRNQGVWSHKTELPAIVTITGDVTVEDGGFISVSGRGYGPAQGPGGAPGANFSESGGGGYGGAGASGNRNIGGETYGSFLQPTDLGSGGGNAGGRGGGSLQLILDGTLTVEGSLEADGNNAGSGGGGSGGSLWVQAGTLAGSGSITATGGNGTDSLRGGGGGGRVSVFMDVDAFSGSITACGGGPANRLGGAGTVYTRVSTDPLGNLIIDNCDQTDTGARTDVTANPVIVPGNVIVRNLGVWSHKAQEQLNARIMGDLIVEADGFVSVQGRGFPVTQGPGGAPSANFAESGGGGYGGHGGAGARGPGGATYGSSIEPVDLGSGGGNSGGDGGGRMRFTVDGTVNNQGVISARGNNGSSGGGGSGGSVLIAADSFTGSGIITANGGNGSDSLRGGGGGGRIALFYNDISQYDTENNVTVQGGTGRNDGEPGTLHLATGQEPLLGIIADDTVPEGAMYIGAMPQVSAGLPPFTFSLVEAPTGMTIDPLTGVVHWAYADRAESPATITIKVSNPFGEDQTSFTLIVEPAAPMIDEIPDGTFVVGSAYIGPIPVLLQGSPPITWSLVGTPPGDMTIDSNTGVVNWPAPTVAGNPHVITIRASNTEGSDDETWRLTIQAPPVITEIADGTVDEGATYTGPTPQLTQGTPAPSWNLIAGPQGMTISGLTGVVTWPDATSQGSPHTITIEASNAAGSDQESWQLSVEASAPEIAAIAEQNVGVGEAFTGPEPHLVKGSRPVTWSLVEPFPADMVIDANTGVVSWPVADQSGTPYTITIRADNTLGFDEATFILNVQAVPIIDEIADDSVDEGTLYTGPTPTLAQGDAPISWSLIAAPGGVNIDAATGVVTWTHPIVTGSPHTITIAATNNVGTDEETWELTVNPVPPIIAELSDQLIPAGDEYTRNLNLTQGTAPVAWSLIAPPAGMAIDAGTGVITWPDPTTTGSPYTISVRAENSEGSDEKSYQLTVGLVPVIAEIPDDTIAEGSSYLGPVPLLTSGSPPVTWSLASGPAGMDIDPATGQVSWARATASATPHLVRILATNDFGSDTEEWLLSVPVTYTATVEADVDLAPAGTSVLLQGVATMIDGGAPATFVDVTIRVRVQNTRRVITALTDENGEFAAIFQPLPNEAGLYTVGADHPSIPTDSAQDTFILVGMRANPDFAQHRVSPGGSVDGMVDLVNLGDTPLTGITASVVDPLAEVDVVVNAPANLDPEAAGPVNYTITSTGSDTFSGTFTIELRSAEGAVENLVIDLTVRPPSPVFSADPDTLVTSMLRGAQTFVSFELTNIGGSLSGEPDIVIPNTNGLSMTLTAPIPSLAPDESTTVELQLLPADDLILGVYSGTIIIAGPEANLTIPYEFTAISDGIGDLLVITEDEFTYWSPDTPPLAGATVVLKDRNTGSVVDTLVTNENGQALFQDLPEAHYNFEATAPEHQTARGSVLIAAGRQKTIRPFLPREVVSYTWSVVPTTIEDRYAITIESVFETNVPAPVVTIEPSFVDLRELGCTSQIDFTITNHGLITANNLHLTWSNTSRYTFEPLTDQFGDLPAMSSMVVPVIIRDNFCGAPGGAVASPQNGGCETPGLSAVWDLICGTKRFYSANVAMRQHDTSCPVRANPCGCSGGGEGGPGTAISVSPVAITNSPCDPCDLKRAQIMAECGLGAIPGPVGCGFGTAFAGRDCASAAQNPTGGNALNCVRSGAGAALGCFGGPIGGALGAGLCLTGLIDACEGLDSAQVIMIAERLLGEPLPQDLPADTQTAVDFLAEHLRRVQEYFDAVTVFFGDAKWLEGSPEETDIFQALMQQFLDFTLETGEEGGAISVAERATLVAMPIPSHVTADDLNTFLDRWNRSVSYWDQGIFFLTDVPVGQSTDFIALDVWNTEWEEAAQAAEANQAEGHEDLLDGVLFAVDALQDALENPAEGVCARVKIRIAQEAVLSRSAFLATLEIENGSETETVEGVTVNLDIRDADGNPANDLFGIGPPDLEGLTDVNGGGSIPALSSGKAEWTIIPTSDAAPTAPVLYTVGGEFTYMVNGRLLTVPLYPDDIEVFPDPRLRFKYFHEMEVFSDDPFTNDVIEPAIPFSLGLMVTNDGAGTANNLRVSTSQPEIIENDKGLFIAFSIIGAQVGFEQVTPKLNVSLGDVDPGETVVARWLLVTNLQGRFIDYDATFEHIDGLGDPRLSLIDGVSIHETIHVVRIDDPTDDGLPDFLVNDVVDLQDLPDTIHSSDDTLLPVTAITEGTSDGAPTDQDLNVELTVDAVAGWIYARADNPAAGLDFQLVEVRRPDGSTIREENFWTTRKIVRIQGEPPRTDDFVHIVDKVPSAGPITYTLVYASTIPPSPADLNNDGVVDGVDWGIFLAAFGHAQGDPAYNAAADLDEDGMVTFVDQQLWLAAYREFVGDPQALPPDPIVPGPAYIGDLDSDGDVDQTDFGLLQRCLTGEGIAQANAGCAAALLDGDADVDADDIELFRSCADGPNIEPPSSCVR